MVWILSQLIVRTVRKRRIKIHKCKLSQERDWNGNGWNSQRRPLLLAGTEKGATPAQQSSSTCRGHSKVRVQRSRPVWERQGFKKCLWVEMGVIKGVTGYLLFFLFFSPNYWFPWISLCQSKPVHFLRTPEADTVAHFTAQCPGRQMAQCFLRLIKERETEVTFLQVGRSQIQRNSGYSRKCHHKEKNESQNICFS